MASDSLRSGTDLIWHKKVLRLRLGPLRLRIGPSGLILNPSVLRWAASGLKT